MAQVNVYVPDDLKAELDRVGIKFSATARDCWQRELSRVKAAEFEVTLREELEGYGL